MIEPFQALEPVTFANGLQCTLQEDGSLLVTTAGRGQRSLTIEPRSDNSVQIRPDKLPLIVTKP